MIRLLKYAVCLGFLLLLSACTPALFLLGQAIPLDFEPSFSEGKAIFELAPSQGIKSDKRPMGAGVYDAEADKTFVAWLGRQSNSFVQAFDHKFGTWGQPKQVTFVQRSRFFEGPDRHNYPLLTQADNGRLLLFYAEHSDELRLSSSPEPNSLDGFWRDEVIQEAPHAAYPMPVKTRKGDIYVFYRESSFHLDDDLDLDDRPMQYVLSKDDGESWRSSKALTGEDIALGSWDRSDNLDEIYMAQIRYQPRMGLTSERIHMVWTLAGGGPEGPKHDRYHKDVYYAYFRPSNKHFYCAGGKDKGVSLSTREMQDCVVEDTGPLSRDEPQAISYIQLVHYADGGKPVLIYQVNREEGSVIRSATWTGRQWQFSDISTEGFILDMEKTGPRSFRFYAGRGRIQVYESNNSGKNWQLANEFKLPDDNRVIKLTVIDEHKEPAHLLITDLTDSMAPSASVYLAGEMGCLLEGEFRIKSASGDYLSVAGFDATTLEKQLALAAFDRKDKHQQWAFETHEGSCVLKNREINGYLSIEGGQLRLKDAIDSQALWTLRGTAEQSYRLRHDARADYLQVSLADNQFDLVLSSLDEDLSASEEPTEGTTQESAVQSERSSPKSPDWQLEPIN